MASSLRARRIPLQQQNMAHTREGGAVIDPDQSV
jgi:hypothetical protein